MSEKTDPIYPINEIFQSFQGEGMNIGAFTTFIRFAGCNLKCEFCDTNHEPKTHLNCQGIIDFIDHLRFNQPVNYIVFTGGEPTLYNLKPLVIALREKYRGVYIALETNGLLHVNATFNWYTVSPKPPDYKIALGISASELKYVVNNDFCFTHINPEFHCHIIWLQPESNNPKFMKKAWKIAQDHPEIKNLRVGIQLHKVYGEK
jgi:organic radical activating enzyme